MPRGLVALLDVLGFSSLVSGDRNDEQMQRYLECLREDFDDESVGARVDYVVFSDSIVLTRQDDSESACKAILLRSSRALGLMLKNEIALRGAISCGSFFRSAGPSGVFVAGRAILEACKFESLQDWVGIMLTPSTIKQVPDLVKRCTIPDAAANSEDGQKRIREMLPWPAFVQPCRSIPFHSDQPFDSNICDGFAIVPTGGVAAPAALRDSIGQSVEALEWLRSVAPSPSAEAKYRHSHQWLYPIRHQWTQIAYWEERLRNEKGGA